MLIMQAFNDFIKAEDLRNQNVRVIMERVELREVNDEGRQVAKPVLYFRGKGRGLVLNKTNTNSIVAIYGEETDDWIGQEIVLYPAMVDFQGRSVPAIRVRGPQPKEQPRDLAPIGVVSRAVPNGAGRNPAIRHDARAELNDEIPF